MEIITESARETQNFGEKLSADLIAGKYGLTNKATMIALYGNLGSGKTTFIQGFARGLGIKKRILSPTFIMMRQYPITSYKLPVTFFYHIDLYRIENEDDVESLGLEEIWSDSQNIVAIEWPEKIEKILPKNVIKIMFDYVDDERRKIKIVDS